MKEGNPMGILSCFENEKPVIGMIHTKGEGDEDVLRRAKEEIAVYEENGVDSVMVETYFGDFRNVGQVLAYLAARRRTIPYGVNCLNFDMMSFELANRYRCDYIQIDSVVGHVKPRDEASLDAFLRTYRERCGAYVMGGVRFKYQPVLSEKTLAEDLETAMTRCDAVCVTGEGTGLETSMTKIKSFRRALGDFPLFVCAGVTPDSVAEQLEYCDGAVVGSYFKDTYKDTGDVCAAHVRELMSKVEAIRAAH
jgi:predicted TIM-barrel enzyme